ncbi:AMP-binding protein [Actinomadura macrotermitis]|uniref:Long-chain-fatty-acid--AMP ligase FadD26 n=1 Tax=Actinomadura macrotermitis TaxID=2585200 RepID=A0A7K0BV55_9ACTN|nr:Long-chain-fatty-acid--AMP ligase FadD26 [Actinomadura macrotermitis]
MRGLTDWLERPRPGRGVHLAGDTGWQFQEYTELAAMARRIAAALREDGVRPGDVVCVVLPTDHRCVAALYGVWYTGATVCPVVPPAFQKEDEYAAHVSSIFAVARPTLTVTTEAYEALVRRGLSDAGHDGRPWLVREADEDSGPGPAADVGLLQFTSGSTSNPRGVRVLRSCLEANIDSILDWVGWRDGDATASWLPLYHDMGLIGCFLSTVTAQGDLWLMRPDQFVRDPARWLRCFGEGRAHHTATPTFGLAYAARRVTDDKLADLDFSGWRTAIVGAEPVNPRVLETFARRLAPRGFSRGVFAPAYGMAEATLAVTGLRSGETPWVVRPDWAELRFGEPVRLTDEGALDHPSAADEPGWLVGCGGTLDGMSLDVRDESGAVLPDRHLGELTVTGTSVAAGYQGGNTQGSTRFDGPVLRTGDAGFLHDGQLYVVGRMGDSLKVRGRSVYLEDLEEKIADAGGLKRGRVAVVGAASEGRSGVAVIAESRPGPWVEQVLRVLTRELGDECAVRVVTGSAGLIERTSSGKPRRRRMWNALQAGRLGGTAVAVREPGPAAG